jgi:hypothetical protein
VKPGTIAWPGILRPWLVQRKALDPPLLAFAIDSARKSEAWALTGNFLQGLGEPSPPKFEKGDQDGVAPGAVALNCLRRARQPACTPVVYAFRHAEDVGAHIAKLGDRHAAHGIVGFPFTHAIPYPACI